MKRVVYAVLAGLLLLGGVAGTAPTGAQTDSRTFPETGKTVRGIFLKYWNDHGGLAQQGYPISDEFAEVSALDGKSYTVQYFERAVFEQHPENAGTEFEVLLAQLGKYELERRYPNDSNGAAAPVAIRPPPEGSDMRYFAETRHTLSGVFRRYWEAHGGLAQQGYPLTELFEEQSALDGKTYMVQYFERAVFEWHPENAGTPYEVLLAQLGRYRYDNRNAHALEVFEQVWGWCATAISTLTFAA